jgi:hypothetical protein
MSAAYYVPGTSLAYCEECLDHYAKNPASARDLEDANLMPCREERPCCGCDDRPENHDR